ncbi:hypothetical protein BB561_005449 [Smittium simulii]|uniref:PDZ domain-containing protein n=1 Tax=Smittium simulii TaxID=133385 RepID=A0A2T9YAB5_9FUNG|nr:hypothetical protein BB561_005449 [Smittium simulii]
MDGNIESKDEFNGNTEKSSGISNLKNNSSSENLSHYNLGIPGLPQEAAVSDTAEKELSAGSNLIFDHLETETTYTPIVSNEETTIFTRKPSRKFSESLVFQRRKSLAQNDLMAVFYYPDTIKQPTITDVPFESKEFEQIEDGILESESDFKVGWEPTLEKAIKAIVSIKANCVRSFDTETSGNYTATGFVVDAKNGIILSNRHVVNPAPIVAQAVFTNYEEVELMPIYCDPVHDFGFFKFDPEKIKFMDLSEIKLAPNKAKVGMEIRVVGNDAGEKLSILSGTLARLDRNSPDYGVGEYNDFNTFYLQAASGTSGGSSGSPVLDIYGDAVALNAGGSNKALSSYYLPLNKILVALEHIRLSEHVPRGTLQTEFEHLPYDELRRLGLTHDIEKQMRVRYPKETGLLCVKSVLPQGPADKILHAGDIVIALNEIPLTNFLQFFSVIDVNVEKDVQITILRCRKAYKVTCKVQDLHSITPHRYIEVGGGVLNELSYQLARSYSLPVKGVYVASSGQMLGSANVWRGSVIISVNHIQINCLDDFANAVSTLKAGSRVPIKYFGLDQQYREKIMIMNVVCHWHPLRKATRNRETGLWDYVNLQKPTIDTILEPQTVLFPPLKKNLSPADQIWTSVVSIDFHIPYLLNGMITTQFYGPGFIINREHGFILCDRDTISISTGDVYVTFAHSLVVSAKIIFLHPVYNFSIIQYDPSLIGETRVTEIEFAEEYYNGTLRLEQGDPIVLVAVGNDQNPVVRRTIISSRSILSTRECAPPRWRATNIEGVYLEDQPSCQGGVLCGEDGKVKSLWLNFSSQDPKNKEQSFMAGVDPSIIRPVLETLKLSTLTDLYSLDVELWTVRPAAARSLGLSYKRMQEMQENSQSYSNFYYVLSILNTQSQSSKQIKTGDLFLEIDGVLVTDIAQIAVIYGKQSVKLTVLRDGSELELNVPTSQLPTVETDNAIGWSGAIIQEPYRAVLEQVKTLPSNIYVTCTLFGSPASGYGLKPGVWITHVEGRPVDSIADFIDQVKDIYKRSFSCSELKNNNEQELVDSEGNSIETGYVRLNVVNKIGFSKVISIRLDEHYWPSMKLTHDNESFFNWNVNFDINTF